MTYLVFNLAKFKSIKYFAIEIPCVFNFLHMNIFLIKKQFESNGSCVSVNTTYTS